MYHNIKFNRIVRGLYIFILNSYYVGYSITNAKAYTKYLIPIYFIQNKKSFILTATDSPRRDCRWPRGLCSKAYRRRRTWCRWPARQLWTGQSLLPPVRRPTRASTVCQTSVCPCPAAVWTFPCTNRLRDRRMFRAAEGQKNNKTINKYIWLCLMSLSLQVYILKVS